MGSLEQGLVFGEIIFKAEFCSSGFQFQVERAHLVRDDLESVSHLFFTCPVVWKIWSHFWGLWGLVMVIPRNLAMLLESLDSFWLDLGKGEAWKSLHFAIIWVAWWVKARFPYCRVVIDDFITDPVLVEKMLLIFSKLASVSAWLPPPTGWLKLNVDGALVGGDSASGIGGLLRNGAGEHLISFSLREGSGTPIMPEILAICYCICLFLRFDLFGRFRLVIESDCKCAIDWVLRPGSSPFIMSALIKKIADSISSNRFIIQFISRVNNVEAYALAESWIGSLEVFNCDISDF
ncbi:hypothetical protein V6N12_050203 [Hibiscus sabdariffa]|uniref:RNase H type-1 domain-containing protein n=1 Tax=Hibiscus sabdariffa TaxID=183260 RepID=A0ABR2GCV4_9ROSI